MKIKTEIKIQSILCFAINSDTILSSCLTVFETEWFLRTSSVQFSNVVYEKWEGNDADDSWQSLNLNGATNHNSSNDDSYDEI